jgi:hypothetical protein
MNTFYSNIFYQDSLAEYEIYQKADKFKAQLLMSLAPSPLPMEITFWKEAGRWCSSHLLNEHVLYQFGYHIDNHLLNDTIERLKSVAA